jgi:hypothetical protein
MSNPGMEAIRAAAAKKGNAGGKVAIQLKGKGTNSGNNNSALSGAIARRLSKGNSGPAVNDNDGDEHDYR